MTGLAIAGGGLKCVAQIGAIKALNELGIKFDSVAGTSSGSIMATLYAMDCSYEEMTSVIKEYYKKFTKFDMGKLATAAFTFLTSGVARIDGLIDNNELENLIKTFASKRGVNLINDTQIPISIVTVDTISAKEVVFTSKIPETDVSNDFVYLSDIPISTAVKASTAFPGFFSSCNYNGYNFIDGGTKNNLPTEPLKANGANKILALSFELDKYEPKKDLMAVLLRTCDIFSEEKVERSRKIADLNISISVPGASLLKVDNFDECCMIGYKAIMDKKDEIIKIFA